MTPRVAFRSLLLASLLLTVAAAAPAVAAWPHDPAAGVPLAPQPGTEQSYPMVVSDDAGGAIVIWQDRRSVTYYDLYAQRIDSQGNLLWGATGAIVNVSSNNQEHVSAIPDGAHGVIVCWTDWRFGAQDIYAQRLNGNGTRMWALSGVVVCGATGNQQLPQIASDGAGGALIAWQDYRNGNADIYAQRLNSTGAPLWRSQGAMACSLANLQMTPDIASDMQGGAFVVWTDGRNGYNDIYAQRLLSTGLPAWTANGMAVCNSGYDQIGPQVSSDGNYGAFVCWSDQRNLEYDVYAQRVSQGGTGVWTANGIPVCTTAGIQNYVHGAGNGRDGMFIAWSDFRSGTSYDTYAQYISAGGNPIWTANGRALCTAAGDQYMMDIVPDDVGGAIAVWADLRLGTYEQDVYAQRVNAAGTGQWIANGVRVGGGPGDQLDGRLVADGTGGAIVAYWDVLSDPAGDVLAQHVERFGHLGDPAPAITRVADVPNDQGGRVQVEWTASYLDTFPAFDIAQYSVWRQVPEPGASVIASLKQASSGTGATRTGDGRVLRTGVLGTQAVYWEQVGTQNARGLPGYSLVASTTSDSMPGSNPYTSFMVMAEEYAGIPYWASAADSGYSVDDLPPPTPAPFTGTYATGTSYLQWPQCPAPDFAEFRLHRGQVSGFVPGPGNLVVAQASAGYVDAAGAPYFYKLCAVDVHGNASTYAFLQPEGTVDVPGAVLPHELALSAPAPNPMRGSCVMRLALPREAKVSLAVYDQQGRRVRTLLAGSLPAGERPVIWNGRDDGGRAVESGIFFVRFECEGRTFTRRVAAVR
jgi:hypothetical protein